MERGTVSDSRGKGCEREKSRFSEASQGHSADWRMVAPGRPQGPPLHGKDSSLTKSVVEAFWEASTVKAEPWLLGQ